MLLVLTLVSTSSLKLRNLLQEIGPSCMGPFLLPIQREVSATQLLRLAGQQDLGLLRGVLPPHILAPVSFIVALSWRKMRELGVEEAKVAPISMAFAVCKDFLTVQVCDPPNNTQRRGGGVLLT